MRYVEIGIRHRKLTEWEKAGKSDTIENPLSDRACFWGAGDEGGDIATDIDRALGPAR